MSYLERNLYQSFLIMTLHLSSVEDIFRFGKIFAEVEKETKCPTPWQVVQAFNELPKH